MIYRKRVFIVCLLLSVLAGSLLPAQTVSASAAASAVAADTAGKPGKVALASVSSDAYNRITVSWKKVRGATSYGV